MFLMCLTKLLKPCEQVNLDMKLWSLQSEIQDVHGSCCCSCLPQIPF